eukprot:2889559-Rhodomonas_salina.1
MSMGAGRRSRRERGRESRHSGGRRPYGRMPLLCDVRVLCMRDALSSTDAGYAATHSLWRVRC